MKLTTLVLKFDSKHNLSTKIAVDWTVFSRIQNFEDICKQFFCQF